MLEDIKIASGYALDILCYPMRRNFGESDCAFRGRVLGEKNKLDKLPQMNKLW